MLLKETGTGECNSSLSVIAIHAYRNPGGENEATLIGYNGNRLQIFSKGLSEGDQNFDGGITSTGKPVVIFRELNNAP